MKASRFVKAKETIKQAFKDDPDFRLTYVANVACYLMDNIPGLKRNKEKRRKLASDIINIVCE